VREKQCWLAENKRLKAQANRRLVFLALVQVRINCRSGRSGSQFFSLQNMHRSREGLTKCLICPRGLIVKRHPCHPQPNSVNTIGRMASHHLHLAIRVGEIWVCCLQSDAFWRARCSHNHTSKLRFWMLCKAWTRLLSFAHALSLNRNNAGLLIKNSFLLVWLNIILSHTYFNVINNQSPKQHLQVFESHNVSNWI
jgi:hypothetical protein